MVALDTPLHVAIVGTNASGKSWLGVELAESLQTEVVSADSRQVYRGFDLCSGKLTPAEMRGITHHLIDLVDPPEIFTLKDYHQQARRALLGLATTGKTPLLVGGTPLYAASIVQGYNLTGEKPDPARRANLEALSEQQLVERLDSRFPGEAAKVGLRNRRRLIRAIERSDLGLSYSDTHEKSSFATWQIFGVTWEQGVLETRIAQRLDSRLSEGMIFEVEDALSRGVPREFLHGLGLEYRFLLARLEGVIESDAELREGLFRAIRRFAKRQMAWFSKWKEIVWLEGDLISRRAELIERVGSSLSGEAHP